MKDLTKIARSDINRGLCSSNKRSYPGPTDANSAAIKIYKKTGNINRAYPCPECGRHHLTSDLTQRQKDQFFGINQIKKKR